MDTPSPSLGFASGWIEDESLYCWCSRFHRLAIWPTRATGRALFAAGGAAKSRLAPANLTHFVRVTKGALGDAATILRERTVIGSYLAFGPTGAKSEGGRNASPKFGALTGLRYCATCFRRHREEYGVALWRIEHQLPGVAVCVRDCEPLLSSLPHGFSWSLPGDSPASSIAIRSAAELLAHNVASSTAALIFRSNALDPGVLASRASDLLCEAFGVIDGKRLRPENLQRRWAGSVLGKWVAREAPSIKCCRPGWISDLLRGRCSEKNPLRWAYLISFLSELGVTTAADFLRQEEAAREQLPLDARSSRMPIGVLTAFYAASSASGAADLLKVSPTTVRRWIRARPDLAGLVQNWEPAPLGANDLAGH